MTGRGRGKALTRPAWMETSQLSTPRPSFEQPSSNKSITDWAPATAADGRPYWYSLSTGKTSWADPSAAVWREHKTPEGRTYYYNEVTKETQWERPNSLQPASTLSATSSAALPEGWAAHTTPEGREYFYHKVSGETRWERPSKSATGAVNMLKRRAETLEEHWKAHTTTDGRTYYYNSVTRETAWTKPTATSASKRARTDSSIGDLRLKLVKKREEKAKKAETVVRRPRNAEGKTLTDRQAEAYFLKRAKIRRGKEFEATGGNETDVESLFVQLLKEKCIGEKSTWLDVMGRCSEDPRYLALKPYGARKHAWLKAKQKALKDNRRNRIIENRVKDEAFLELMEEVFSSEPSNASSLERCNPEKVKRFESESRFRAVEERKRSALIKSFLGVRSRKREREHTTKRKGCMLKMRIELDNMVHPSFLPVNGTAKPILEPHGKDQMVDVKAKGQGEAADGSLGNVKIYFNDRTPFRDLERFLVNISGSEFVSDDDRAVIIREWRKYLEKLVHEKRSREREARKALQRERRANFRSGVEWMFLDGRIDFSAHWKDVSELVLKESFAMSEEELDARLSDLFHDGLDLFLDRVLKHRDEFKRLLKEADIEVHDSTTAEELKTVEVLMDFIKGLKESVFSALLADRKRRESRRRQKEVQRATEDFEELLRRSAANTNSSFESAVGGLKDRTAYKHLHAVVGNAGVQKVYDDYMKRWNKGNEQREGDKNPLKRKHDNPSAPIPFDHEALAALERAKRIRLPGVPVPAVPVPPVTFRAPLPPPVHVEEESGWAAAVSAKPMTEQEKLAAKEKRKRELLGTLRTEGEMHMNGKSSSRKPK